MKLLLVMVALCVSSTASAHPEDLEAVTVDMLLEREYIGHVTFDESKGLAYFEKVHARSPASRPLPYITGHHMNAALKKIYVTSLDETGPVSLLFEQEVEVGYFFVSDKPWSPSGRYLGVFKLEGRQVYPGVYDTKLSRVEFFDVAVAYHPYFATFHWLSDEQFIVVANEASEDFDILFQYFESSQEVFERRRVGWRGSGTTVQIVGAGSFAETAQYTDRIIQKVDVTKGSVSTLYKGPVERISVSKIEPRRIAVGARTPPRKAKWGDRTVRSLAIFDTTNGSGAMAIAPESRQVRFLGWSSSGRCALVSRSVGQAQEEANPRNSGENFVFSIVDAKSGEIIENLPHDAVNPTWVGNRIVYSSSGEDDGGSHQVSDNGIALKIVASEPKATDESGVYFLESGNLWRFGIDGERENLTLSFQDSINVVGSLERYELSAPLLNAFGHLEHISSAHFISKIGGHRHLIRFTGDGGNYEIIQFPNGKSQLVASSANGFAFVTNTYGVGSELHYAPAGENTEPRLLHRFNTHMAQVSPAVGPIQITHTGYDRKNVSGWLYLPPGASLSSSEKYPLIVIPYGGFVYDDQRADGLHFASEIWDATLSRPVSMQVFAALGYAVLLPSVPLAGMGRASEPMSDLRPAVMTAVDGAIATGFVDPNRLAVSGQSYGGYTALSLAAQTDRFDAVIAMAPVSNLTSIYGVFSPFGSVDPARITPPGDGKGRWAENGQGRMGASPWRDPERYVRNSPLFFADKINTPSLLIHGELDAAVSISQSEEMFSAFFREGLDALLVMYFGEHHLIEQPQNQRDMWKRIFNFLKDNGVAPNPEPSAH